jgi:hypothetical protein
MSVISTEKRRVKLNAIIIVSMIITIGKVAKSIDMQFRNGVEGEEWRLLRCYAVWLL